MVEASLPKMPRIFAVPIRIPAPAAADYNLAAQNETRWRCHDIELEAITKEKAQQMDVLAVSGASNPTVFCSPDWLALTSRLNLPMS